MILRYTALIKLKAPYHIVQGSKNLSLLFIYRHISLLYITINKKSTLRINSLELDINNYLIEPPNLSKIECGMHFPQPEKIERMAQSLNVEIAELFDFEHFEDKNKLLNMTKNTLDSFDNKKLQLAYKIINAIKLF